MSLQPIVIRPEDIAGQFDGYGKRIPRPMNAFMLYANEMRRKLKESSPSASNKEISVRLGKLWSNLPEDEKQIYYRRSKLAEREHGAKYPEYRYCPSVSKVIKAMRKQENEQRRLWMRSSSYGEKGSNQTYAGTLPTSKKRQIMGATSNSKFSAPVQYHIQKPGIDPTYKFLEAHSTTSYTLMESEQEQPSPHQKKPQEPRGFSTNLYPSQQDRIINRSNEDTGRLMNFCTSRSTDNHILGQTIPRPQENSSHPTAYSLSLCQEDIKPDPHTFDEHLLYNDPSLYESESRESVANIPKPPDSDHGQTISESISSGSLENSSSFSESSTSLANESIEGKSDYVMIPCDINIARMLGWPVHLLQRVPSSTLESLREEAFLESSSEVLDSIFPGLSSATHLEEPHLNNLDSPNMLHPSHGKALIQSSKEVGSPTGSMEDPFPICSDIELQNARSSDSTEKSNHFIPNIDGGLGLCPMDNEFDVFPSSDSSDSELDRIDTSTMSTTFGHLDGISIDAYRTSCQDNSASHTAECY